MLSFVKKLLKPSSPGDGAPEAGVNSAGVREDESMDALYEEFSRTFCHKPGVNFMEYLRENRVTRMIKWLRPTTRCAVPKGFIRLAVDMTRKGSHIWEADGPINMRYDGGWDHGGLPGQESLDALSVLAQILKKSIVLYFTETQGGPLMLMRFDP